MKQNSEYKINFDRMYFNRFIFTSLDCTDIPNKAMVEDRFNNLLSTVCTNFDDTSR